MPRSLALAVLLSVATAAYAQSPSTAPAAPPATALAVAVPSPPAPLPKEEFRSRREALGRAIAAAFPDQALVVLLRGAAKASDMGPFVQDQDFLYLTGVAEPDLALLLQPSADGTLQIDELLVPPFSRFAATWDGKFLAPGEESAARTGFATAGNVRGLGERLTTLLAADADGKRPLLLTNLQASPRLGSTPSKAAESAAAMGKDPFDGRKSREQMLVDALQTSHPGLEVKGLERFVSRLRHRKSPAEIELLRASSRLAGAGIAEAMRSARPGLHEFHLAAAARFVFSLGGAGPDAYAAIVGGGPNGCILHYNACDRQLLDSDLIVMDYAPTLRGYASDVTRTFPASGKFSPAQRKLVQDVHDIQLELIAMVKPGARLSAIGAQCAKLLQARGYQNDHGPCHHVGLAVHDPSVDVLQPGMVITVEPGAYLRKEGMGCRIEDTILVTEDGCEILSDNVPKSPDAIEALMAELGLLERPARDR
jgi:Xaa-Pro aminopeptidase